MPPGYSSQGEYTAPVPHPLPASRQGVPPRPRPRPVANYDVAVIGASLAGSVCAALLGRAGYRVLLIDKATFPRTKICGEGLMPAGRKLLLDLGLGERLIRAGARDFSVLRFHLPNQRILALDFSDGPVSTPGCVLSRDTLDHLLVRFAASQEGVEVREGCRLREARFRNHGVEIELHSGGQNEVIQARAVVAADGIQSRLRAAAGIRCVSSASHRFALRRLYSSYAAAARAVDVYCLQDSEAYVAPMSGGRARITLLTDKRRLPRSEGVEDLYESLLARFPEVLDRVKAGGQHSPVETTSPVSTRFSRCHGDRLILAGDAAGAVDPVTGQGMTMALRDAHLSAQVLSHALKTNQLTADSLQSYSCSREHYFLPTYRLSQQLLTSLRYPWLAERARLALSRSAGLRTKVIALAADPNPETVLSWIDQMRLVVGC